MKRIFTLVASVLISSSLHAQLDLTFGTNGHVVHDITGTNEYPTLLKPTLDNGFITSAYNIQSSTAYLVKYLSNGAIDSSFAGGLYTHSFPNSWYGSFFNLHTLNNNSVYAVSNYGNSVSDFYSLILKLNSSGVPDSSFDVDGRLIFTPPTPAYGRASMVDSNNKILLAGTILNGMLPFDIFITRYDSIGQPDSTFGVNGILWNNNLGMSLEIKTMYRSDPQHYMLVGYLNSALSPVIFIRINNNGTIDTTFGNSGVKALSGFYTFILNEVKVTPNAIYLLGSQNNFSTQFARAAIIKTDWNGEVDSTFGNGPVPGMDFNLVDPNYQSTATGLEIDPGGRLLISGTVYADTTQFFLIRKLSNYSNDFSFGMNGSLYTKVNGSSSDFCQWSCLLTDHSWIVGGYTTLLIEDVTFCKVAAAAPLAVESHEEVSFQLFPNPAHQQLHFHCSTAVQKLQIYSLQGSLICELHTRDERTGDCDISMLPQGHYIVIPVSSEKATQTNTVKGFSLQIRKE
jgi:uncharacterized delta-60 repeat protein